MTTELLNQIKRERSGRKKKRLFERTLLQVLACIVKQYRLSESFLDTLDRAGDDLNLSFSSDPVQSSKTKPQLTLSPFPLLPPEEYMLCRAIIERLDCPYLYYARSPGEIRLCKALHTRNELLDPEELATQHFETLLRREIAGETLAEPESDSTPFPHSEAPPLKVIENE